MIESMDDICLLSGDLLYMSSL